MNALTGIAAYVPVVFPLYPRAHKASQAHLHIRLDHLIAISPVGYLDMLCHASNAIVMVTDSGNVMKEAFLFRIPCYTLRSSTEWVASLELGWTALIAPSEETAAMREAILFVRGRTGREDDPYCTEDTAEKIATTFVSA